jgi:hypothetical protein
LASTADGTARTITAAAVTLVNCDFQDITGAGAGSWSGTSVGNALGNSGITFTTPVTRYGVVAGNFSSTATWSTSTGGAGGASVPLCHDTVVLDASSAAGTYTNDMPRACADLTCTGFTRTLSNSVTTRIYGSVTLGSGMTLSMASAVVLTGRGSTTLTSAGKVFGGTVQWSLITGTCTLGDAFATTGGVTWDTGTFTDAGFSFTAQAVNVFSAGMTINLTGTVTLTATSATPWTYGAGTVNASTATIVYSVASASSRIFQGGGKTYGTLTYTVAGSTGQLQITGQNTFGTINFSDITNARTLAMPTSSGTTVTGTFNVNGTSGKLMTVTGDLTKASGTVSCDYLSISNSDAAGGAAFYAGANSTNGGSNTGWIFTAAPNTGSTGDSAGRSLNRLAGTTGLDAQGAANVWAGTVGKDLVGALNTKAGGTRLEYNGVCRLLASQLGGNSELDAQGALASIP